MSYEKLQESLEKSISATGIDSLQRKNLLQIAENVEITHEEYKKLRAFLFDLFKQKDQNYINWLEDAMKILDRAREITYTSVAFFSPENSGQEELEKSLLQARKSIWVCVFTISDDDLAHALIRQHEMGLDVKVITDNDKIYDKGSDIFAMKEAGIPVKIDDTSHHMHHKFVIIDREILINGSYNWTRSADEYNHENLIKTKDEALVKAFSKEFERLWNTLFWLE